MSLRMTLNHRLNEAWHGSPWYGDPSDTILKGITAEEASRRIAPDTHTIWQIVLHMAAWTEATAARVRGIGSKGPDRGDWPDVGAPSAERWAAALADLEAVRKALLADLDAAHEEDLHLHVKKHDPPFQDTGVTRGATIVGLIEHDAYHLGQVALLKRALRAT